MHSRKINNSSVFDFYQLEIGGGKASKFVSITKVPVARGVVAKFFNLGLEIDGRR